MERQKIDRIIEDFRINAKCHGATKSRCNKEDESSRNGCTEVLCAVDVCVRQMLCDRCIFQSGQIMILASNRCCCANVSVMICPGFSHVLSDSKQDLRASPRCSP